MKYDTSAITVRNPSASRMWSLAPTTVPDMRKMLKMSKAIVSRKIKPTIVLPVAGALSKGTRSVWATAKGDARHCGQACARSNAVVFAAFWVRNCAVCAIAIWVISGLTMARTAGTTLELTVIWLRAEATKSVSEESGEYVAWPKARAWSRLAEALGETGGLSL